MIKKYMSVHFYYLEFPIITVSDESLDPMDERVLEVLGKILKSPRFSKYFSHSASYCFDDFSRRQKSRGFEYDIVLLDNIRDPEEEVDSCWKCFEEMKKSGQGSHC